LIGLLGAAHRPAWNSGFLQVHVGQYLVPAEALFKCNVRASAKAANEKARLAGGPVQFRNPLA
jgi:hypothetical protein